MGQPCCSDHHADYLDYNPHEKGSKISLSPHLSSIIQDKNITPNHFRVVQQPRKTHPIVLQIQQQLQPFHHSPEFTPPEGIKQIKAHAINNDGLIYDSNSQWKDGLPHGKGKLFYPDGSLYIGYFWKGVPSGQGRFISTQGWYYQGALINEQAEGKGIFSYESFGYHYEGNWSSDLPNGQGKQTWIKPEKTQIIYEGEFINGKKHGKGKYKSFQWEYEGNFSNNEITGSKGVIKYANGEIFQGDFLKGKKHGFGIYRWVDGSSYEGSYQNDKKQGHGKYISVDGNIFEGQWKDGKRQGEGVLIIKGTKYCGVWHNDKPTSTQITEG